MSARLMQHSDRTGFTLIEVVIVLGLVGIVATFGVAMSYSSLSRSTVAQERDLFVNLLLRGSRSAAISNLEENAHGVQIDNTNHRYILFTGTNYDENNTSNRILPYTSEGINVTNSGGDTIVFEQLSGNIILGAGTISIGNGNMTQEIIIRESGQIDW